MLKYGLKKVINSAEYIDTVQYESAIISYLLLEKESTILFVQENELNSL